MILTCLINLAFAVNVFLIQLISLTGARSAVAPSGFHADHSPQRVIFFSLSVLWLAAAVGLFFRKRSAWWFSVVEAIVTVCFALGFLLSVVWAFNHPDPSIPHAGFITAAVIETIVASGVLITAMTLVYRL